MADTSHCLPETFIVKDSGTREEYETGAVRDNGEMKGAFELIPPQAMFRLALRYEGGAQKYGDHNWEKGIKIGRCFQAAVRHLFMYLAGANDEDHLAAAAWNIFAIMHYEAHKPEMQNLPAWQGRKSKFVYPIDMGDQIQCEAGDIRCNLLS
jgi:hypothetical protein